MNEAVINKENQLRNDQWSMAAALFFFIAAIFFHVSLLLHIKDQNIRMMYYDAMNTPDPPPRQDFNALYTQSKNLVSGKSIYTPIDELLGKKKQRAEDAIPPEIQPKPRAYLPPFRYLPAAALVGLPFTLLPFDWAYPAWVVFHEILIFLALYILFKSTAGLRLGLILGGMLMFFAPYYLEIFQGQFSWPQAFLMLLVFYNLEFGPERKAMWAFIVTILWKLNTLLWVIPIAMAGRRRWLVWLVVAVFIGSVPYFLIHPGDVKAFIGINLRPDLTHSYHFGNSGLRMLIDVLLRRVEYFNNGTLPDVVVKYSSLLVALILFGLTTQASWRRRHDLVGCLLIFSTLYFLIYIDVWVHHWLMILPVVIWEYKRTQSPFVFVIWFLLALPTRFDWIGHFNELKPFFPTPERVPHFNLALLYFSQKSIPALALWVWQFIMMMRKNGKQPV